MRALIPDDSTTDDLAARQALKRLPDCKPPAVTCPVAA